MGERISWSLVKGILWQFKTNGLYDSIYCYVINLKLWKDEILRTSYFSKHVNRNLVIIKSDLWDFKSCELWSVTLMYMFRSYQNVTVLSTPSKYIRWKWLSCMLLLSLSLLSYVCTSYAINFTENSEETSWELYFYFYSLLCWTFSLRVSNRLKSWHTSSLTIDLHIQL